MGKNRIIRAEFWDDEKLSLVSRDARLSLIGLWTNSDDYGVVRGNPSWLKARIYPYDTDLPIEAFQGWLDELEKIGEIVPFVSDGEKYYCIVHFVTQQAISRPSSKGRNPKPSYEPACNLHEPACNLHEPSCNLHEPSCNLHEPACNLHEPSCNLHEPACNLHEPSCNSHEPSCNLHEPSCNLHEPACNLHEPSCNSHDPSCNLHEPSVSPQNMHNNNELAFTVEEVEAGSQGGVQKKEREKEREKKESNKERKERETEKEKKYTFAHPLKYSRSLPPPYAPPEGGGERVLPPPAPPRGGIVQGEDAIHAHGITQGNNTHIPWSPTVIQTGHDPPEPVDSQQARSRSADVAPNRIKTSARSQMPKAMQDRFDRFWAVYPRRVSKGQAERAFAAINPDEPLLACIISGVKRAMISEQWTQDRGKYIPYPATWLRARGWEDEHEINIRNLDAQRKSRDKAVSDRARQILIERGVIVD